MVATPLVFERWNELSAWFAERARKLGVGAADVALSVKGETRTIRYSKTEPNGTSLEARLPPLGCVGKLLTAQGVLELVNAGRLSLHDTVADRLGDLGPKVADATRDVRIGHLLAHTSGIVAEPSFVEAADFISASGGRFDGFRNFAAPGEIYSYENANFILLGELLRRLTGQTWPDAVQELVLDRYGCGDLVELEQSPLPPADGAEARRQAIVPAWCTEFGADVETLARFANAHLTGALTQSDPVATLMRQAPGWTPSIGDTDVLGFAFKHSTSGDYGHFGFTDKSRVDLTISPRRQVTVVIATSGPVNNCAQLIAEMLGRRLGLFSSGRAIKAAVKGEPPSREDGYSGTFVHEYMRADVRRRDGDLYLSFVNDSPHVEALQFGVPATRPVRLQQVSPRLFAVSPKSSHFVEYVGEKSVDRFKYMRIADVVYAASP